MTINLLPPKIKQEKEYNHIFSLACLCLSSLLVISGLTTFAIFFADSNVNNDIKKSESEIVSQEGTLKKLEPVAKKISVINSKLEKISSAEASRVIWSNVLKDLANDTPQKVQIKTLSLSDDEGKVQFTGIAATRRDIAAFKEKLEESKYFKNVTFYTSSHNTETDSFSYTMSAELEAKK